MSTQLSNLRRAWSWRLVRGAAGLAVFASEAAAQVAANETLRWNTVATEASAAAGSDPLTESRLLAIIHLAMHDAVNAVERRYQPYRSAAPAERGESASIAAASAAHAALVALLPAAQAAADDALTAAVAQAGNDTRVAAGLATGRAAAMRILALRKDDAGVEGTWQPGTKPGAYRPTPPENLPAFLTRWGKVAPFALRSASQFRPLPHPALSSAAYAADLAEVQAIGEVDSSMRTAEQTEIAKYGTSTRRAAGTALRARSHRSAGSISGKARDCSRC